MSSTQDIGDLIFITFTRNDDQLVFMQAVADKLNQMVDTETEDYQKLTVDGLEIYYLVDDTHGYYQWINNNYLFSLDFTGDISQEEVLRIIASVSEKNNG